MRTPQAAAIYARISSDIAGTGAGVKRQVEDCRKLAASLGWPVAGEYTDNDISATSGKRRPDYQRMLADLADGTVDAVIVYHIDRLTRRPIELEEFLTVVDQAKVRHVRFVTGDADIQTLRTREGSRPGGHHANELCCQFKSRLDRPWLAGHRIQVDDLDVPIDVLLCECLETDVFGHGRQHLHLRDVGIRSQVLCEISPEFHHIPVVREEERDLVDDASPLIVPPPSHHLSQDVESRLLLHAAPLQFLRRALAEDPRNSNTHDGTEDGRNDYRYLQGSFVHKWDANDPSRGTG